MYSKTISISIVLLASLILIFAGIFQTNTSEYTEEKERVKILSKDYFLTVQKLYYSVKNLPKHQLYCIPKTKVNCSSEGCRDVFSKVFVLLSESGGTGSMSRCDESPCDTYPVTVSKSGVIKNINTVTPRGLLFKMSALDNSYVEVVTIGTDALISHGYCYKNLDTKDSDKDQYKNNYTL
jgi:hypothetical protein